MDPGDARRDAIVDLYRGKAEYRLAEFDKAHADWLAALRLDPLVPEAGWCLLELYYLEGRSSEARELALRLHEVEPDPRARVQFLLELLRQDAQPMAPESVAQWFEPAARQAPDDLHIALTLGLALARTEQPERGLGLLAHLVQDNPTDADAWGAWLTGLDDAGEVGRLQEAYTALPPGLATTPRFARHKARLALERGDFQNAVVAYRRALLVSPGDQTIESRLAQSLRLAGGHGRS